MTTVQDQGPDEAAVQTMLRRLGVGPRGGDPNDAPPPPVAPPPPAEPPTVHLDTEAAAPAVPGNRMPNWRTGETLDLTAPADQDPQDAGDGDLEEPVDWHGPRTGPQPLGPVDKHDDTDEDDEEQPAESRRRRALRLLKGERAEQHRPQARPSEEPADDQGKDPEDEIREVRRAGEGRVFGRRAAAAPSEHGRPRLSTPVFPRREAERKSFAQAWREVDPATKWGLYHGSGLVGGLAFGVVSFATDVTRSVAESPLPLRDNPDAYFWTVGAVLVLAVDRVTRRWAWLVRWCTRGVTTSLIIGAVLHGNTIGDALRNMPTLL